MNPGIICLISVKFSTTGNLVFIADLTILSQVLPFQHHIFSEASVYDLSTLYQNIVTCLISCSEMPGSGITLF